jgi:16S rRNA A1518/A1519 N6-dimethyltransferase RsmA/KsgA/DIM1 with predicted DNA glycosylase/AP lyase activity
LNDVLGVDLLKKADINGALRPEELTIAEWCRLADIFHDANKNGDIK